MSHDHSDRARSYRRRDEQFYPVIIAMTDEQPTRRNPVIVREVICCAIVAYDSPMTAVHNSDELLAYYNAWRF